MSLRARFFRWRWTAIGLWHRAASDLAFWAAAGDCRRLVLDSRDGEQPLGARVCVFVHFDRRGVIRAHTRRYLEALAAQGLSLVFVTNSGALEAESLAFLTPRCARILIRRNRGYDFGAYRDAILELDPAPGRYAQLVIANDSVYGPIAPLADALARMDFAAADAWGLTDSWQQRYHVQSYFVAFGGNALAHPGFLAFWRGVRNVRSKWAAIKHYEIGLTQALQAHGLRFAAVWDYFRLMEIAQQDAEAEPDLPAHPLAAATRRAAEAALRAFQGRTALNPTSELWLLLALHGYPFIKRELLRDNPGGAGELSLWHRIARERAPAVYREVIEDLKRTARKVAP